MSGRPPLGQLPTLTEVIGHGPVSDTDADLSPDLSRPRDVDLTIDLSADAQTPTPAERRQRLVESMASTPPPVKPAHDDLVDEWAQRAWLAQAEAELVQSVLTDVQRQVDHLFEYRVREALGPLMARLTDALVRETREELATIVRDIVRRAVAQEIAKQRLR